MPTPLVVSLGLPADKEEPCLEAKVSLDPTQVKLFEVHALGQVDCLELGGEDGEGVVVKEVGAVHVAPAVGPAKALKHGQKLVVQSSGVLTNSIVSLLHNAKQSLGTLTK